MKPNPDRPQDDKKKKITKGTGKKTRPMPTLYGGFRASVLYAAYVNQTKAEMRLGVQPADTHILDFYQFKKSADNLDPGKWGLTTIKQKD